jgi:hypothetical protein
MRARRTRRRSARRVRPCGARTTRRRDERHIQIGASGGSAQRHLLMTCVHDFMGCCRFDAGTLYFYSHLAVARQAPRLACCAAFCASFAGAVAKQRCARADSAARPTPAPAAGLPAAHTRTRRPNAPRDVSHRAHTHTAGCTCRRARDTTRRAHTRRSSDSPPFAVLAGTRTPYLPSPRAALPASMSASVVGATRRRGAWRAARMRLARSAADAHAGNASRGSSRGVCLDAAPPWRRCVRAVAADHCGVAFTALEWQPAVLCCKRHTHRM